MKSLFTLMLALSLFLVGCDNSSPKQKAESNAYGKMTETQRYDYDMEKRLTSELPNGATNFKYIGNGWGTFDLNDAHFLFHTAYYGYSIVETITQVK